MDFSHYGEATEEWHSYVAGHPDVLQGGAANPNSTLSEFYTSSTAGRAAQDHEKLKASGLEGTFTTQDHKVPTSDGSSIPLRLYAPNGVAPSQGRPVYIHYHGGGFTSGSIETEGYICAFMATKLNMIVLHPCYRHVHEAKHPTQHHDAWTAIEWTIDNIGALGGDLKNLVVGGISSGGTLAASVTQRFFASGKGNGTVCLKGQVFTVPWLIMPDVFPYHLFADEKKTSLVQCADAASLTTERLKWLSSILEAENIGDVLLNPPLADDKVLRSLPKTAFIVAGGDMLRDDALLYATKLKHVG